MTTNKVRNRTASVVRIRDMAIVSEKKKKIRRNPSVRHKKKLMSICPMNVDDAEAVGKVGWEWMLIIHEFDVGHVTHT